MIVAINYADEKYKAAQKYNTNTAYKKGRVNKVIEYSPSDIDPDFYRKNIKILSQPRGNGYWLWKPYFIYKSLKEIADDDYLVYADSGSYYVRPCSLLIDEMERYGDEIMFFRGGDAPLRMYTKRDIFIKLDSDNLKCINSPCILAGFLVIKKTLGTLSFIEKWLYYAQYDDLITDRDNKLDEPNYEGFVENRHDQAILGVLAYKYYGYLYGDPTQYGLEKRYHPVKIVESNWKIADGYGRKSNYPVIFLLHRHNRVNILIKIEAYAVAFSKTIYGMLLEIDGFISKIVRGSKKLKLCVKDWTKKYLKRTKALYVFVQRRYYNYWCWSQNRIKRSNDVVLERGNSHPENIFYIICRNKNPNSGLGALIDYYLAEIKYAYDSGYIPVIDMESYASMYLDEKDVGIVNAWENYFQQPSLYKVEEAYKGKRVIISYADKTIGRPDDSMLFLNWKHKIKMWNRIFRQYMQYNCETARYITNQCHALFGTDKKRILGVLCRGTDYIHLKPIGHSVQPPIKNVIEKAEKTMKNYQCDYIFLATEDAMIVEEFAQKFGDRLIKSPSVTYRDTEQKSLAEIHHERSNDTYLRGLEYLATLELLSRCNCIIAGRTYGLPVVLIMNGCKFEYTYFWDLGKY